MQRRRLMIDTEITPGYASWQTAGTYTFSIPFNMDIDVFLVGGGGGGSGAAVGSGGGGGGGYTKTYKWSDESNASYNTWIKDGDSIKVNKDDIITIRVGSGGLNNGNSESSYIIINGVTYTANGGDRGSPYYNGGDGGSGGGANGGNGHGGSDGFNGTNTDRTGGYGQIHTTYPFGELEDWITNLGLIKTDGDINIPLLNIPYSGGGGGGRNSGSGIAANGGLYGGGNGSANSSTDYPGTNGYGGGGGGSRGSGGGTGGCGCVIIRWGI